MKAHDYQPALPHSGRPIVELTDEETMDRIIAMVRRMGSRILDEDASGDIGEVLFKVYLLGVGDMARCVYHVYHEHVHEHVG